MLVFTFLVSIVASTLDRVDLTGKVLDPAGNPVNGARILMYTAEPRLGVSSVCPSCYLDCSKSSDTDEAGTFLVRSLDASLIFRILVIGEGFEPSFVDGVDPSTGPIEIVLKRRSVERLKPRHFIRGRVIDPETNPVVGAEITPENVKLETEWAQSLDLVDPVAITNSQGDFVFTSDVPFEYINVKIAARGLAPKRFEEVSSKEDAWQEMQLTRGASVTGRVLIGDRPLPGVVISAAQTFRSSTAFDPVRVATDEMGRFHFSNLAPGDRYHVYGIMDSLKEWGGLPVVERFVGTDESITVLDDMLVAAPGHRVSGRVILADDKPAPLHTRVLLTHNKVLDFQLTELDKEGRFSFEGLLAEEYRITSLIEGYRLSPKNASISPFEPSLEGQVDRDIVDLTLLYEPVTGDDEEEFDYSDEELLERAREISSVRRQMLIRGVAPPSE